jgi:thioredoxin 1
MGIGPGGWEGLGSGAVHEADDETFASVVLEAAEPVLVDFSATWCGPCKKLEPVVREIAAEYAGRIRVVKVDVDRAPRTAARYAVLSVPRLLLFREGKVQEEATGVLSKRSLAELVERVLAP